MDQARRESLIPAEVRIGVIGHLKLERSEVLAQRVREILATLDRILDHTPHRYVLIAAPDQGAARIAAVEFSNWKDAQGEKVAALQLLLPTPVEEYLEGFDPAEAEKELRALFELRSAVRAVESRSGQLVGQEVIRNCGVLIAIWNGQHDVREPTAFLMNYARRTAGRTVFWINPITSDIKREDGDDGSIAALKHLDTYNSEHLDYEKLASEVKDRFRTLEALAYESGIRSGILKPLVERLLPHFVGSERIASRCQFYNLFAASLVYSLGVVAITIVTSVTLFYSEHEKLLWAEVIAIAAILALILASFLNEWLRRWIDCRLIAERLRANIFLFVAGMRGESMPEYHYLSLVPQPTDWKDGAVSWICNWSLPSLAPEDVDSVKNFALKGWIEDQGDYYRQRGRHFSIMQGVMTSVGFMMFALTLITALMDAGNLFPRYKSVLTAAAIILPVIGTAAAGLRAFQEYVRSSEQYKTMAKYLNRVKSDLERVATVDDLRRILGRVHEEITREHATWQSVVAVHEPWDLL